MRSSNWNRNDCKYKFLASKLHLCSGLGWLKRYYKMPANQALPEWPPHHRVLQRWLIRFFLTPLLAGEAAAVLPTTPLPHLDCDTTQDRIVEMFLPGDGGRNGITLLYLWAVRLKVYAELYVLGYGGWGVPATTVPELELSFDTGFLQEILPPVHVKVFVVTASGYTLGLGLDLVAASFFTLQLPVSVRRNYKLSCAEDAGLYLVGVDGFQLTVWLHRMSGNGNGAGWLLVDTFYV
ncbi:hypothetical protein ZWY2020_027142 [Hordeum vulgare]|nr:hypothetical protein ZWY2020_027142 [Hordeum vulgare]